jgi:tetratricopeptide (TPR) repeat protein
MLQAPEILLRYLALLAIPARLTLDRSQDVPPPDGPADPRALLAVVACALLIWGLARVARRVPAAGFGGAWFVLAYFPTSNTLIPLYSLMGEQYMYIASMGVVGGAVAAARAAARATGLLRSAAFLGALLVAGYGARSALRTLDWHDEVTLLQATLQASPRSAFYRSQLGHTYTRMGRLDLAEGEFQAVVEMTPSDPNAHLYLADVLLLRGNFDQAETAIRRAIALGPDYAEGYYGMAVLAHRRGDDRNETLWLEMASAHRAARVETVLNMGLAYLSIDPRRAALHLRRFLALAPGHPQAATARALLVVLPSAADR